MTLRKGLVFAGLLRGGSPGQSPPNNESSTGSNITSSAGSGFIAAVRGGDGTGRGRTPPRGSPLRRPARELRNDPPSHPEARMPIKNLPLHLHIHSFLNVAFRRVEGPGDALRMRFFPEA